MPIRALTFQRIPELLTPWAGNMARNLLTDKEIRNARPRAKGYRLPDGDRLFVWIAPTGGKSFQFRYKNVNGKGQTETLKQADTLAEARDEAEHLRKIVDAGDDPRVLKRVARAVKVAGNARMFKPIAEGHRGKAQPA